MNKLCLELLIIEGSVTRIEVVGMLRPQILG